MSRGFRLAALLAATALLAAPAVATAKPELARTVRTVASPVGAAAVLKGAQIHGMVLNAPGTDPMSAAPSFARLRADGVNLVSVYIAWQITNSFSSDLHAAKDTPSDRSLKQLALLAHRQGLAVEWMPIVTPKGGAPRYNILPNDMVQWWSKYTGMIDHYATLGRQSGVEVFSIGSEYTALQKYSSKWLTIIDRLRHKDGYHGLTTYMSVTGNSPPFPDLGWWGSLDLLSVSPYWSLSPARVPVVGKLVGAWRSNFLPALKRLWTTYHKPVLMDEIGYADQDFAAYRPAVAWRNHSAHPNQQAQANAYEALLQVSVSSQQRPWLAGVVWFYWGSTRAIAHGNGYSPQATKAECVIARYWAPRAVPASHALLNTPNACVAMHAA